MLRSRMVVLVAGLAVTCAALGVPAQGAEGQGHEEGPPSVTGSDLKFKGPSRTLRAGTADEAGLLQEYVDRIVPSTAAFMEPGGPSGAHPSFPGFAVLAARNGVVVEHNAGGYALRYERWDDASATAVELPRDQWVPMRPNTIFDMASVTKLLTSVVATQMDERGELDLDATVSRYLPEFAAVDPAKAHIVVKQLLTHTSGMVAWTNLYTLPDNDSRMQAIYTAPLRRVPGSGYEYSDLNLIVLGENHRDHHGILAGSSHRRTRHPTTRHGWTLASTRRPTSWTVSPQRSSSRGPDAASSAAPCTTRTHGRSAALPAMPASSPPSMTWRSSVR